MKVHAVEDTALDAATGCGLSGKAGPPWLTLTARHDGRTKNWN
jgi:hypothetical protein